MGRLRATTKQTCVSDKQTLCCEAADEAEAADPFTEAADEAGAADPFTEAAPEVGRRVSASLAGADVDAHLNRTGTG